MKTESSLFCVLFFLVLTLCSIGFVEGKDINENFKFIDKDAFEVVTGYVEIVQVDNFDGLNLETKYYLNNEYGEIGVNFNMKEFPNPGDFIRAKGYFDEEQFFIEEYEILENGESLRGGTNTLGEQRVAVVLVNFQDDSIEPITVDEASNRIFNEGHFGSLNSWTREVSYGRAWVDGDVYGWYTLQNNSGTICGVGNMRNAVKPLIDEDIDFREYSVLIIVHPQNNCPYYGISNIGPVYVVTNEGIVQFSTQILNGIDAIDNGLSAHEFGHNLGMRHANDLNCLNVPLGESYCTSIEYGDYFDIMGAFALTKSHYNVIRKEMLGWLNANEIVVNPSPGIYYLNNLEFLGGIKSLKFSLIDGNELYAEYRRPVGYDSFFLNYSEGNLLDGLFLRTNEFMSNGDTQLIDTTPSSSAIEILDSEDVALREGQIFDYLQSNIYFEVVELTDNYAKVRVGRPVCGDGILDFDLGEQCDGSDFGGTSCTDVGLNGIFYDGGQLSCRSDCTFDTNQCTIRASCKWDQDGNGFVNPADRGFVSVMIGCSVGRGNPLCDLADVNDDGFVNPGDRGFISANLGACSA